jgi:hypothetical protein
LANSIALIPSPINNHRTAVPLLYVSAETIKKSKSSTTNFNTNVNFMEECKNSVAMDCQAVDTPHQEAGIKRPPPSKPLMKPEDKRPTPAIPHNRTEAAANALTPLSLTPPVDDPLAALQLKIDQLV